MHNISEIRQRLVNNFSGLGIKGTNMLLVELVCRVAACEDELTQIRRELWTINDKTPNKPGKKTARHPNAPF